MPEEQKDSELHELVKQLHEEIASSNPLLRVWHTVLTIYGPYAFGLASLLVIWLYIVQPQLQMQALDFSAQQAAIDALQELNSSQRSTADILAKTSSSLEIVSATLERTAEKMAEIKNFDGQ